MREEGERRKRGWMTRRARKERNVERRWERTRKACREREGEPKLEEGVRMSWTHRELSRPQTPLDMPRRRVEKELPKEELRRVDEGERLSCESPELSERGKGGDGELELAAGLSGRTNLAVSCDVRLEDERQVGFPVKESYSERREAYREHQALGDGRVCEPCKEGGEGELSRASLIPESRGVDLPDMTMSGYSTTAEAL